MRELTKQRITKPLLSIFPMLFPIIVPIVLGVTAVAIYSGNGKDLLTDNIMFVLVELGMLTAAVVSCIFVKSKHGTGLKEIIHFKNFDFAVPVMLTLFIWSADELCDHFGGLLLSNFMTVEPNENNLSGIIGFISAVILAPLFEEIIFRFGACELPRGAYSMPIICIADGIFFAWVHNYNIQGFFNVFIGGVCAAYVYCKTRNILYTMLEHAIHNALCFIPFSEISIFGTPVYYEKNGFVLNGWWYGAIHAVILAVCLVYYFKVFRKKYTENYFEVNPETGLPNTEAAEKIFKENAAKKAQKNKNKNKKEKSFQNVCCNLHIVSAFVFVIYLLGVLIKLINIIILASNGSAIVWEKIPSIIMSSAFLVIVNFLRLIFKQLKKSETPFLPEVVRRIKAIAYTFVISGGVYNIITWCVLGCLQALNAIPTVNGVSINGWGMGMIAVGCIFWAIAYIFNHGCKLQQESDETL